MDGLGTGARRPRRHDRGAGPAAGGLYPYLPVPAGAAVTSARPDPAALGPWSGFALFCLYTAVVLALAAWQLRRRDA